VSDFSTGSATSVVGRKSVSHQFRVEQVVLEKKYRYNLNSMVPAILAIIWKCTSADQLRVFNFICGIMTCCKLGHRSIKNNSKVINILWFDYLNCHLMISFAQANSRSEIQPVEEFMNDTATPFLRNTLPHTLLTLSLILSPFLPCLGLCPALI